MAPPKRNTEAVLLTLHRNTLQAIEKLSEEDPQRPNRQEVIRRILIDWFAQRGIDASE